MAPRLCLEQAAAGLYPPITLGDSYQSFITWWLTVCGKQPPFEAKRKQPPVDVPCLTQPHPHLRLKQTPKHNPSRCRTGSRGKGSPWPWFYGWTENTPANSIEDG
jgi:hypothetical protein